MNLVSIVEGKGDVGAVRELVRRIAYANGFFGVKVLNPLRIHRHYIRIDNSEFGRYLALARRRVGGNGAVLLVFDADDDCPKEIGPQLQQELSRRLAPLPTAVVLANREFESWFLAAIESLRGCRGIREDAVSPTDPESIRGAKEQLRRLMVPGREYRAKIDQVAFAAQLDLHLARQRSRSFDKFYREVCRLLSAIRRAAT